MATNNSFKYFLGMLGTSLLIILTISSCSLEEQPDANKLFKQNHRNSFPVSMQQEEKTNSINFTTELIELTINETQTYFVNYRLKREQSRQETKEMLRILLDSDITKTRVEAQTRWLTLMQKTLLEGEIENSLKFRGITDVVSEVNPERVTVTILTDKHREEDSYQVKRLVENITGYDSDQIVVVVRS